MLLPLGQGWKPFFVKVVIGKCVVSPHGDALESQYFDTCLDITNGIFFSIACFKFRIG